MPGTTLNIDALGLRDLKGLQKKAGRSLRRLVSDLLAQVASRAESGEVLRHSAWVARSMQARIDLADKEAVRYELTGARQGT